MSHDILLELAGIIILGIMAQWLAWRFRLPSILLLLGFGFLAGPVTGFLDPDHLMGDLLLPVVSISVAVILFEGGLSLRVSDLREIGQGLILLVTVGLVVTWVLITLAARSLLGFDPNLALLLGAILVVTGPTVVIPLLRHVRPHRTVGSLIKWEGILNDPIGAVLAVLVFEFVTAGGWEGGTGAVWLGVVRTIVGGLIPGVLGAGVMVLLLRFYHVPDYLENAFTLMMVILVYTCSDIVQAESGLASVTVMGIVMANQKMVPVKQIIEFKENLRVLLISSLFILLAARLDVDSLSLLGVNSLLFLLALIFVVRPVAVFLSTLGSRLTVKERVFLSWMAPRGIVAAAVSSVFALRMQEAGSTQAAALVPVVFLVIVGTVAFYGLTAGPVARRLGISGPSEGCLLVGGHSWVRAFAEALVQNQVPVLLVDINRSVLAEARLAGISVYQANILSESLPDELPLEGIGRILALTSNDEVNSLAALHFSDVFGKQEAYQLTPGGKKNGESSLSQHLRGRLLFGPELTYDALENRFRSGAVVKVTTLSDEFGFTDFQAHHGTSAVVLAILEGGEFKLAVADEPVTPKAGQTLIALVDPAKASDPDRNRQAG